MMKKAYQNPTMTLVATEFADVLTSSVQHAAKGWGDTLNVSEFEDLNS